MRRAVSRTGVFVTLGTCNNDAVKHQFMNKHCLMDDAMPVASFFYTIISDAMLELQRKHTARSGAADGIMGYSADTNRE